MAKADSIKVKLVSSADTGFYYVTRKNSRTMTDKLVKKKYDPANFFRVNQNVKPAA
ncbi:MAG: 50S ribosomal protein L33 [Bradyrhizobium sp.]